MKRILKPKDQILQMAREMRRVPTPAEEVLWSELRGRRLSDLKFRRQHVIGPFIADFYCASARLVVEVDGDIHDFEVDYDAVRTRQLEDFGYRVIRFKNDRVMNDLEQVLSQIAAAALTPGPSPDSGGGEVPLPPESGEGAGDEGMD